MNPKKLAFIAKCSKSIEHWKKQTEKPKVVNQNEKKESFASKIGSIFSTKKKEETGNVNNELDAKTKREILELVKMIVLAKPGASVGDLYGEKDFYDMSLALFPRNK